MEGKPSPNYIAKCHRALTTLGAPLMCWYCADVIDFEADSAHCELCGNNQVRYIHVMHHAQWPDPMEVGCVCAGVMEGDMLAARERERLMTNRTKRKRNYLKKAWKVSENGNWTLRYKGKRITLISRNGSFGVMWDGPSVWRYRGQRIANLLAAKLAVFDLVDPPVSTAITRGHARSSVI